MTKATLFSLASMLVLSILAVVYMVHLGLPISVAKENRASFVVDDTNGLVVGSRVLLRGSDIGTVTSIDPSASGVSVGWEYDHNVAIPVDSDFRVDNLSALGETYISVLPQTDSGPFLADGAHVQTSQVHVPTTIKQLSERFTKLLNQLNTAQLQAIFAELKVGLPSGSETIDTIRKAGALTAAMLDGTSGSLNQVLINAQRMLLDSGFIPPGLAGTAAHIADFATGFNNLMSSAVYLTELSPLPDSLVLGTGPLLANLQAFLDRSASDIKVLAVDLLPAAQAGGEAMKTINASTLLDRALSSVNTGGALTVNISSGPN